MSALHDTAVGAIIRLVTRNKYLQYPEERADFKLPEPWLQLMNDKASEQPIGFSSPSSSASASSLTGNEGQPGPDAARDPQPYEKHDEEANLGMQRTKSRSETLPYSRDRLEVEEHNELDRSRSIPIMPRKTKDGAILVDWYYSDDKENPQNWSSLRRGLVTAIICFYTFVVYMSSAIYTTSESGVMEEFGVGKTEAALGLSLFVLGYGTGPLIFSPLSELPAIGRNPIYIVTMFLYTIISIPTALVQNYPGLMVLRFLQGFFGSPCLASGGASVGDMYNLMDLPYAMIAWVASAYLGPSIGPLLSGFSVPVMGWRWSLLEVIWAASPVFLVMFLFLPETSTPNILLRRAQRLRKLTGDARFMSQSEIDQQSLKMSAILADTLVKPIEITFKDPAILFVQVYTAIIYGIYYSFFEVFPLVYPVYYGMSPGEIGLVFLCVLVACALGIAVYASYIYFHVNPRIRAHGWPVQESRLVPALPAAFGPTVGLFIFAWTAAPQYPWIAPTIGITLYGATVFVVMQCIFV